MTKVNTLIETSGLKRFSWQKPGIEEKKEDKSKVQESDQQNKVEIESDKEKEDKKKKKDDQKGSSREKLEDEVNFSEGNLIDITV